MTREVDKSNTPNLQSLSITGRRLWPRRKRDGSGREESQDQEVPNSAYVQILLALGLNSYIIVNFLTIIYFHS